MHRYLSPIASFACLLLLGAPAFGGGDEHDKAAPRRVEIRLRINGEDVQIEDLDELKKYAQQLSGIVDLEAQLKKLKVGEEQAEVIILKRPHGDDDEANVEIKGNKALFVGKDGKVQVLDRDDGHKIWVTKMDSDAPGKFMIGLACQTADDTIRSQLRLDAGGLVVLEAIDDTPAAAADIRPHDVLITADGKALDSLITLIKAVDEAGAADRKLSLQLYRRGKKKTVEVKPQARPDNAEWKIELEGSDEAEYHQQAAHGDEDEYADDDDDDHDAHADHDGRHEEHSEHEQAVHEHGDQGTSRHMIIIDGKTLTSRTRMDGGELAELKAQLAELRAAVKSLKQQLQKDR